ncbi:hypothetical protein KSC_027710 [Ktedonobacter sp. SOSP1-52]|nr:hypothetical protein KSC_027710 [Ktedonobacter sp. SOSP1-52]
MTMMLVTGPTSAVGNAVLKELLARKIPVRAFVRKPSVAEKLEAQGVETFLGDMTERESVQKALQGIERVSLISPTGIVNVKKFVDELSPRRCHINQNSRATKARKRAQSPL